MIAATGIDGAERVRDVRDRDQPRARREQRGECVEVELARLR